MFMFAYIEVTQDITTGVIPLEAVRIPYRKGLTEVEDGSRDVYLDIYVSSQNFHS